MKLRLDTDPKWRKDAPVCENCKESLEPVRIIFSRSVEEPGAYADGYKPCECTLSPRGGLVSPSSSSEFRW